MDKSITQRILRCSNTIAIYSIRDFILARTGVNSGDVAVLRTGRQLILVEDHRVASVAGRCIPGSAVQQPKRLVVSAVQLVGQALDGFTVVVEVAATVGDLTSLQ